MGLGWTELVIILILALVLFGPKRLPEVGSSLGRGIREFRQSLSGVEADLGTPEGGTKATVPVEADTPRAPGADT